MPRFAPENFSRNLAIVQALGAIAKARGITTAQLAFAWVRSRGDDMIALVGARRRDQLAEALAALEVALSPGERERIERTVPATAVAGGRYAPAVLAHIDSEHPA
jgi:aryl-alcohol dehydrogenase-like predicted oxidoreductase